ncbi:MAG TPA: hypothetical protein VGM80_17215 [Gaiellaceae bacterium]|jgi:hypothetical protein
MRTAATSLLCGIGLLVSFAATAAAATTHATTLTPAEQKWVAPLITVWNNQNTGLRLVIQQAGLPNAFVMGSKPNNEKLAIVLGDLLSCKRPQDRIQRAGKAPSARIAVFGAQLNAACIHDQNGAHAFSKAMVAFTGNQPAKVTNGLIKQGIAEFKKGSAQITKAYKSLTAIGGSIKA